MIAWNRSTVSPIGLHLESRSVTLAQLDGRPGHCEVYALAHAELPFDPDLPPQEQDRQVAARLREVIADHRFYGRNVVSCLGAQDLFVQNVRVPQLPPEEIAKVVRWEAEERLQYPVAEAEVRHINAGQVRQDANVRQEIILLACHQTLLNRHIAVLEQAGLMPVAIDVEPCAVLRCLHSSSDEHRRQQRTGYLHLGERAATVIFADGEDILFLKYISGGTEQLDQALARRLDLNYEEAARMRSVVTSAAELDAEDEVHRSVIDAIRQPLESMVAEIELCLRYYKVTFRGRPLERILVTGTDATPWIIEYFESRFGTPCEFGNPLGVLERWPTNLSALERPGRWTTAFGLSLKPADRRSQAHGSGN